MEKNKVTILIVSFLILLLSGGVVYFLALPSYKQVGVEDSQISQINSQIVAKKNYYSSIDSQSKALEDAGWAEKKKSIEINFTSTPFFIPKMNIFFQTMATGSGMALSNITSSASASASPAPSTTASATKQAVAQGSLNKTSFNITVKGAYNSFKKFLSDLETQTRIVTVKSIAVSPAQQTVGRTSLNISQFNLIVDTYSY